MFRLRKKGLHRTSTDKEGRRESLSLTRMVVIALSRFLLPMKHHGHTMSLTIVTTTRMLLDADPDDIIPVT
jgi:hypothetical protein